MNGRPPLRIFRNLRIAARTVFREVARAIVSRSTATLDRMFRSGQEEWDRRNIKRPADTSCWFVAEETLLVKAVSSLLIPSENGPGADEAGVVDRIDGLLRRSPELQAIYGPGLIAFDSVAVKKKGRQFAELDGNQQRELLLYLDGLHHRIEQTPTLGAKIRSVCLSLRCRWDGSFEAVQLFPTIKHDVMQAFYTSQVCWKWLRYYGPPMPRGYYERRMSVKEASEGKD